MSHDYEKDLEIIGAADSPPTHEEWCSAQRPYVVDCNCRDVGWIHPSEVFRTHFNPYYTKQLVKKAMERDALEDRVEELRRAMHKAVTQLKDADPCLAKSKAYGIIMEELLK